MSDIFREGRRAKAERQRALGELLCRPPSPEPATNSEVDALVDAVAQRVVDRLKDDAEPEPEPRPRGGFDGGTRQSVPLPPETHEETLARLLRTGEANAGRSL